MKNIMLLTLTTLTLLLPTVSNAGEPIDEVCCTYGYENNDDIRRQQDLNQHNAAINLFSYWE